MTLNTIVTSPLPISTCLTRSPDQIAFCKPVCLLKIVFYFCRKFFQVGDDLLQFSLLSLFINFLFGLAFKVGQTLPQALNARFKFLFFNVAFGVTINQTSNGFASAGNLGLKHLYTLLFAIGDL